MAELQRSWRADARCKGTDPNVFFPETALAAQEALAVCADCEVRAECGEWALVHLRGMDDLGVWGGMRQEERRRVRRELGLTGRKAQRRG